MEGKLSINVLKFVSSILATVGLIAGGLHIVSYGILTKFFQYSVSIFCFIITIFLLRYAIIKHRNFVSEFLKEKYDEESFIKEFIEIVTLSLVIVFIIKSSFILAWGNPYMVSVQSGSMSPTIKSGDLVVMRKYKSFKNLENRDIIIYKLPQKTAKKYEGISGGIRIIHRVVRVNPNKKTVKTKGDASDKKDPWTIYWKNDEGKPYIIGKKMITIPKLGYFSV